MHKRKVSKKCKVTIIALRDWPFHVQITSLFIDLINSGVQGIYAPRIMRVDHRDDVIKDIVRQVIFKDKTDIIIPIGGVCAVATKAVVDDIIGGIPALFVGVRDPLQLKLVKSLELPGLSFTGVVRESPSVLTVADYFLHFSGIVSTVLIPYSINIEHLHSQALHLKQYLGGHGMQVILCPIPPNAATILDLFAKQVPHINGILLLEGCYTNSMQAQIAHLCWQERLVLCGSGPHAVANGAACGLAGGFEPIAAALYDQLRLVWEEERDPSTVPVVVLRNNEEFFINVDMLLRVGVPATEIDRICQQPRVTVVRRWTAPLQIIDTTYAESADE